ncbi:MAG: hypothetical protein V4579_11185 [Pseudomonadota bacterium]
MTYQFLAVADQAMADGAITAHEIIALRRDGWSDGCIQPSEAEALFELNHRLAVHTREWVDFFIEAQAEYVLAGGTPRGFISEAQAEWLMNRIDWDGHVGSMAELELLAKLFEKAERVPQELKGYALAQIEQIVLTGHGPTRDGGSLDGACITDAECRLLRRFLFAYAGDGPGAVSQTEAEVLFRIKDATLGAPNAPDWQSLFVQGVANHLTAWQGWHSLSADRARALENFMNNQTPRIGAFVGRWLRADIGDGAALAIETGRRGVRNEPTAAEHRSGVDGARMITDQENAWLQRWIAEDRRLDDLETALLRFLAEEVRR